MLFKTHAAQMSLTQLASWLAFHVLIKGLKTPSPGYSGLSPAFPRIPRCLELPCDHSAPQCLLTSLFPGRFPALISLPKPIISLNLRNKDVVWNWLLLKIWWQQRRITACSRRQQISWVINFRGQQGNRYLPHCLLFCPTLPQRSMFLFLFFFDLSLRILF